ncbi:AAA family ATPase [Novosphingobium taihuense]|uniref:AAA+ ATPase domain-containing protein n=1 Tax=Novosphingobium taihuense TaxID=260085 RepID=A0A7W7EVE5_9SPHN|nr:AAA family ATPase [Novosphingobium taihuense]MBB4615377.1 hypothetical protein [Novosphingobium taihuense]TWH82172.1 MoxR-like ATPase [Novosphingobium taihuense]
MNQEPAKPPKDESGGSSPVGRGGAGTYIEGELGAYYLLQMLAGSEARGLPDALIERVQFQGMDEGYALDDLIVHAVSKNGSSILEIQSKRTATFAPKDPIFISVCDQIARSAPDSPPTDRHLLAVAIQRTSFAISGPYQDVLAWARSAASGSQFFARLALKGVASPKMRDFGQAFRTHLVAHGIADDDEVIWSIIRRFLILEFDFESGAPQARDYALMLARQVLAPEDADRAEGFWSDLIALVIKTGTTGGSLTRRALIDTVTAHGFRLAGDRNFLLARSKLSDMSRHALTDIGTSVGGITLPRLSALAAVEEARDAHRFIEITGDPGVGKSWVLRHLAERQAREGQVIVFDPITTPDGGWSALSERLGIPATAREFLGDIAASGGGILFIDGLEMFAAPERQRTVNDVLREIASIEGFSVVVSTRPDLGVEGSSWLAEDAIARFGAPHRVLVGELDEDEVAVLIEMAPELRALLLPDHPAAPIARNLYRLTQLLKVPSTVDIRTEAALAHHWWDSADGAETKDKRAAQRLLAGLAEAVLSGRDTIDVATDSDARTHLLNSRSLSETHRDKLGFGHDVLRDWAIGARLDEDITLLDGVDLTVPPSPRLARGIEFAGRFALESATDGAAWRLLLDALGRPGAHAAWRRQALLAITRSELSAELLSRCSKTLLAQGGALLIELCTAIIAVETMSAAVLFAQIKAAGFEVPEGTAALRTASSPSAPAVLMWCFNHQAQIPVHAIASVVKLVEIQFFLAMTNSAYGQATAGMLFDWLLQLDVRETAIAIPSPADAPRLAGDERWRMIEDLRSMTLLLAANAPEKAKAYLRTVARENDIYKVKAIRPFSKALASVAPAELAALIEASLIEKPRKRRSRGESTGRVFGFADSDYLPASPAQPPFLELLDVDPQIGLALIRTLVAASVDGHADGKTTETNGFTIVVDGTPRIFPWVQTYFWSRQSQAPESSVGSALKALEAWSHERLDRGEEVATVLQDILGPEGSCAAYLVVAIDVLMSHWPATRDALVPFVANPHILASDRDRASIEMFAGMMAGEKEPSGRVLLADLAKRGSRRFTLEELMFFYLGDDDASSAVRRLLAQAVDELGPYEESDTFRYPAFMGAHALNLLDRANWVEADGQFSFVPPPAEAEHLARLETASRARALSSDIGAKIQLATNDPARGSAETARQAAEYAAGDLPDDRDEDYLKARSTRLIATAMLVARDGDDALLAEYEAWVRAVIDIALIEEMDAYGSGETLSFNRPGMAICALVHLWHRRKLRADRGRLVEAAVRGDRAAIPAFIAARGTIDDADPRVIKSAIRMALARRRYRWHPYNDDPADKIAYEAQRARQDGEAVSAEIAWLDGGPEPDWPALPDERPSLRNRPRAILSRDRARSKFEQDEAEESWTPRSKKASVHVETQGIAKWLALLNQEGCLRPEWFEEIVDTYAPWSARLNAHGYSADAELDRSPDDWNQQFYLLVAAVIMDTAQDRLDALLKPILELPDRSFCDVADTLTRAADACYFNERGRPADRACAIRRQLVTRTMALDRWAWDRGPGELRIDFESGPTIGVMLMNEYNLVSSPRSYLVPAVFDRIDPLLETLRPMMPGGPTAFVALCTMNTLLIGPTARHLDFLLFAIESWLEVTGGDRAMWHELAIGRKVAQWFESATKGDPSLCRRDHAQRLRIDAMLGRLVSLGVSEAHELELKIEAERNSPA